MPVPFEEMDMVATKQFVNKVKRLDSGKVAPLPQIKVAKPLTDLVGEPFQYEQPAIIDDWRKQHESGLSKGRTSR